MMVHKKNPVIFLLFIILALGISSCSLDEPIKIKVTCYGGSLSGSGTFDGTYELDDSSSKGFKGVLVEDTYRTYEYEKKISEEFEILRVHAHRVYYDSKLIIKIYRNGSLVKDKTLEASTSETSSNDVEAEYTYGEEDESSTTSTTTKS